MSENLQNNSLNNQFTPKELFFKYVKFLPLILISLILALGIAWVKLRYSNPVYNVSAKMLVKEQNPYGDNADKFGDIFMMPGESDNLADEIEIIKSRNMAMRVVKDLNLSVSYALKGKIRTTLAHPNEVPFAIENVIIKDSSNALSISVTVIDNKTFKVNERTETYYFNQQVSLDYVSFKLKPRRESVLNNITNEYIISIDQEEKIANQLSNTIDIVRSEGANVLIVTYPTENTRLGVDIVNKYMQEYQQSSLEDKQIIAYNTLEFIDEQLDTLYRELGGVEKNLQQFKESNKVINPQIQSELAFNEISETNKILTEQNVKLKVLDYLYNYISEEENKYKQVSALGIEDPAIVNQINEYNQLQMQREAILKTTPAGNQTVKNLEGAILKSRNDVLQNVNVVRQSLKFGINDLTNKVRKSDAALNTLPRKEKQLLEVSRQQNILQELYSFLLQKKLETAISSASTISNITVLESALAGKFPVSPNRKGLYAIALFLGLAIPVGIIFLTEYLNDKVKSRNDVLRETSAPIIGEIGHSDKEDTLVVSLNNRHFIAEQFRIIRSNLKYVLPPNENPTILVTSSFSGEGKSFMSTNLGAVLALSGKKTLILEFDIRKPKVQKGLGLNERKGITNFIVGNNDIQDLIVKVPEVENLYVLPCGPIPPNPSELLLDPKIDILFDELKKIFDVLIIDSAPVGMVSDGISLAKYCNSTVYMVRHNYTLKKQISLINDLYTQNKLPRLSIVINDIKTNIGYGSYYGYGYGYGYGFGLDKKSKNSYFEVENYGKNWFKRLFGKK